MRTKLTLAALLSLNLAGCVVVLNDSSDYVKGNGSTTTETRSIASATGLRVENRHRVDMDVEVKVGGAPSLEIEGDSNLVPLVHTEVRGDTLRVWTEERIDSRKPIHVRYTVQRLDNLFPRRAGGHVGRRQRVAEGAGCRFREVRPHRKRAAVADPENIGPAIACELGQRTARHAAR